MKLKSVKPNATAKDVYYSDRSLGSFKIIKGMTKEEKKKAVIIEEVPNLAKGINSVGI